MKSEGLFWYSVYICGYWEDVTKILHSYQKCCVIFGHLLHCSIRQTSFYAGMWLLDTLLYIKSFTWPRGPVYLGYIARLSVLASMALCLALSHRLNLLLVPSAPRLRVSLTNVFCPLISGFAGSREHSGKRDGQKKRPPPDSLKHPKIQKVRISPMATNRATHTFIRIYIYIYI